MVIQARQAIVMMVMQQAGPCLDLPLTISFASPVPNVPWAPQRLARMPSDKREPGKAPNWEVLIQAIAEDQDREAFARLFAYFAPRVKAFMQRSGVAADAAEELVQETMINVWRKAELFDAIGVDITPIEAGDLLFLGAEGVLPCPKLGDDILHPALALDVEIDKGTGTGAVGIVGYSLQDQRHQREQEQPPGRFVAVVQSLGYYC